MANQQEQIHSLQKDVALLQKQIVRIVDFFATEMVSTLQDQAKQSIRACKFEQDIRKMLKK